MKHSIIMCIVILLALAAAIIIVLSGGLPIGGDTDEAADTDLRADLYDEYWPADEDLGDYFDPETLAQLESYAALLEEDEPAYTQEQVDEWVDQLKPLVEEAAGRRFTTDPEVGIATRAQLTASLVRDLQRQAAGQMPWATQPEREQAVEPQAQMLAAALLGQYSFTDRRLYLAAGNTRPLLRFGKVDEKLMEPIVKLVVAHELTHSLQDQHVDISAMIDERSGNMDALQALSATVEGHAVFIQDKVGERLGLDDATMEFARLLSAGAVEFDDPALHMLSQIVAGQFEQVYLGGRDFITHHFREGGTDRLWEILAAPPSDTSTIAAPETYGTAQPATIDYAELLTGLTSYFGGRSWMEQNTELSGIMLSAMYDAMSPGLADEIIPQYEHVQALVLTDFSAGGVIAGVSLMVLTEDAAVPALIARLEEAGRANVQRMSGSGFMTVSDLAIEDFQGIEADAARQLRMKISVAGQEPMNQRIVRIARGRVMLEFMDVGADLAETVFADVAEEVFRRYADAVSALEEEEATDGAEPLSLDRRRAKESPAAEGAGHRRAA